MDQVNTLVSKHSPSYLAALQMLQDVKQHPNADIQSFATLFMQRNQEGPFRIETLLDELKLQFRSNNADHLQVRVAPHVAGNAAADDAVKPKP